MKEEWGKGYATEVLHNFKEYMFTNYNINALNLIIFPTNTASKLLSYSKDLVIDATINSDRLNSMKVVDGIDKYGFVKIKGGWNEETELYCVIRKAGIPSLYHGKLGNWK